MSQVWRVFYLLAAALPSCAADGAVSGVVVNSVTGRGVPGVQVDISPVHAKQLLFRTVTDRAGEFQFPAVPAGEHTLTYDSEAFEDLESGDPEETVQVSAGVTARVRHEVDPLTEIEGKVLDSENHGVKRIVVELLSGRGQARMRVTTDSAGGFHVPRLHPGVYLLRATPDRPAWNSPSDLTSSAEAAMRAKRTLQAPAYYPGVATIDEASPIRIYGEREIGGFDIRLRAVPALAIRGKVVDPSGDPLANAVVQVKSADTSYRFSGDPPDAEAATNSDGRFELPAVTPGKWYLLVSGPGSKSQWKAFVPVRLVSSDVDDLDIRLSPPFVLDVSIEGAPEHLPTLALLPVDGPSEQEAVADFRSSKARFLQLYPGRYRISFSPRTGYYLASVFFGSQEVLGRELDLREGSPPLRGVYKQDGGSIHGTVADGAGATVVLVPEAASPDSWQTAQADAESRFSFLSLRPGNYFLIAVRVAGAVQDPAFSSLVEQQGRVVHADAREASSVDLRLTLWPH